MVDGRAPLAALARGPVLSGVKLIAEPWDLGDGGYQVGNFPPQWSEWNGHYRDSMRDVWRGEPDTLHDFGRRFTGSADLYAEEGRTDDAVVEVPPGGLSVELHGLCP